MRTISILTPCHNEEDNIEEIYNRVRGEMLKIGRYRYEHIFIDNSSKDNTVAILKRIAARDHNVKIIVNARNFGHVRSPMHAFLQTRGDAVIGIVADLQDPPELIPEMIAKWEEGYSMVLCIKRTSEENPLMFWVRKKYYAWVQRLSSIQTFENFTGFGLYDRKVVEAVRLFNDPYPYFRGMIAEIGLPYYELYYDQRARKRGITKNNFYTLYDIAMLGITNLSKVPLRFVTLLGFACSILSLLTGLGYLVYKLVFWANFNVGIAPLVIGLFFLGSVQLLSMGILGEYIGSIHTQVQKRPYVIEKERINFEHGMGQPRTEEAPMSQPNMAHDLLSEALAASGAKQRAQAREHGLYDAIAGTSRKIVVFGSGYLGKVARSLARNAGLEVLAFADNDPAKHGRSIDGVMVMSPAEAVSKFNADAAFVVGVFNSAAPRQQLQELGCERIMPFAMFFWRFPECFPGDPWFDLPHAILDQTAPMRLGYECLSDEKSRQEFAAQIQWRCTLDYACLPLLSPGADTYYEPELVRLILDEVLVDCGAFDGDSIRRFLDKSNHSFRHIYAIEPDPRNRAALESSVVPLLNDRSASLSILPYGLSSRNETVSFAVTGTAGSHITTTDGNHVISIECRRLDDILDGPPPTFIKMDIEGAEPEAIRGAAKTIRTARPIMAVCAYHKCDHLWTIPVLLREALPDYRIFLRRYAEECWELVYYAIPPERLIAA